ncbi:MAG: response regulator transcription factor [Candidatus Dormibacteria bacterium]|jgi:two-component system KDP operon response regulator KdpE
MIDARPGAAVLVVEDDPGMGRFLVDTLEAAGYRTSRALDGRAGLAALGSTPVDMVILDLGLPDIDGMDVLRTIRQWEQMPLILVVSARGQEADKVAALRAGADDYIAKPFGVQELLARVEARLRRHDRSELEQPIELGRVQIDLAASQALVGGRPVRLTPMEKGVLQDLARHRGRVRTHREILAAVWGPGYTAEHAYVRTIVQRLRAKLEEEPEAPRLLLTIPGVGYLMQGSLATAAAGNQPVD